MVCGADLGWLRAEQQAGERYRGLLAMTEGDDAVLPAHLVDERWAWWKATAAYARLGRPLWRRFLASGTLLLNRVVGNA